MNEDELNEWLCEQLGFRVRDRHIETHATRKNFEDKLVPAGVRPATDQEIKMWDLMLTLAAR